MATRNLLAVWLSSLVLCVLPPGPAHADGVTVLIHGWQLGTAEPAWTGAMQAAIDDARLGDEDRFGKITVTGTLGNLTAVCSPWDVDLSGSATGEIVVRVDWHAVADHLISRVPAQDVAAVVAPKIYQGQSGQRPLAELPIHLVGHSRGGGMVCELARLLGEQGIEVEHVSPLDPHPLTTLDPQPIPPVIDTQVAVYENVLFIDNYWQGIDWPEGEYVSGAYNRQWTSIPGGYHNHPLAAYRDVADHLNITLMYHATVDLSTPVTDGEATAGASERSSWFNAYETDGGIGGQRAGFYYSRINGEADHLSTDAPVTGGDRVVDGYHNDPLLGGSGSRSALSWSNAEWPNVVTLDALKDGTVLGPGSHYAVVGEVLDLRYTYRDYDTASDVTFYFDEDRNPYNSNTITTISTESHSPTGSNLVRNRVPWDTSGVPGGSVGYVCTEIADATHTRYKYGMSRIHVLAESPLSMTPPGNALDLDGVDDYLSLPASISAVVESVTVEAWVYSNTLSQPSEYRAVVAEVDTGDSNVEFELFLDGSSHNLSAGFYDGAWHSVSETAPFPMEQWVHVAATYDGHHITVYRDGIPVASSSDLGLSLPDGLNGWRIARSHDSGNPANLWEGMVDEVRVWATARSEPEIQGAMNHILGGDETGLVAYYRFDQSSGAMLWNLNGERHHGALENMTDGDWVTSAAAVGHESHVGTGTGDLVENADVPVDLTWDDDPGTGAIFAAIQVDDEPDVMSGLLTNWAPTYWELWISHGDGAYQADARFHFDALTGISDETALYLYTRGSPGQGWNPVGTFTRDYEGSTEDGVGSVTAHDLSGFSQFILTSDEDPIPVELASFTATAGSGEVILCWATDSEFENLGFRIYRSCVREDGYAQVTRQLIEGAGTSSTRRQYSHTDKGLANGTTYWYKLSDVAHNGTERFHGPLCVALQPPLPLEFGLVPSVPNPFSSTTSIRFQLPAASQVLIEVRDLAGRLVTRLVDRTLDAGHHSVRWHAEDAAQGTYVIRMKAGAVSAVRKVVLVR